MKKTIREMILQAAANMRGRAGAEGQKAEGRRPGRLPGEAYRAEEIPLFSAGGKLSKEVGLCRIVGFIPLSRGSNSRLSPTNKHA